MIREQSIELIQIVTDYNTMIIFFRVQIPGLLKDTVMTIIS